MGPPCQPLLKRQALSLVRDGQTETEREREENGKGWLSTCCAGGSCHLQPWPLGTWTQPPTPRTTTPHPAPSGPWGPASSCSSRGDATRWRRGKRRFGSFGSHAGGFYPGGSRISKTMHQGRHQETCPCQWFRVCMVPLCHLNSSVGSTSIPDAPGRGSEDPTVCMGARLLRCWLGQSSQFPNIWPYSPGLQLYLLRGARRAER